VKLLRFKNSPKRGNESPEWLFGDVANKNFFAMAGSGPMGKPSRWLNVMIGAQVSLRRDGDS